jgi:hypothetical protein
MKTPIIYFLRFLHGVHNMNSCSIGLLRSVCTFQLDNRWTDSVSFVPAVVALQAAPLNWQSLLSCGK